MTNTISNAQATDFSSRITELRRSYAADQCKQTVYYAQTLTDGSVQYIENASRADAHRAYPILPVGYRAKGTGKTTMVTASCRCSDEDRDREFWSSYAAQEREEFPFDEAEPIYFTAEQIQSLRNGNLRETVEQFLGRVSAELPRRYKKQAEAFIDDVLFGLDTAPITFAELRNDAEFILEESARIFMDSVSTARAKYTPKKYRECRKADKE